MAVARRKMPSLWILIALSSARLALAIQLTREENAAVLQAAMADPDASFHSWATKHEKPYALALQPFLQLARLVKPSESANSMPEHQLVNNLVEVVNNLDDLPEVQPQSNSSMAVLRNAVQEYSIKRQAWADNIQYAASHNAKHPDASFWLGVNSLADLSFEDYKKLLGMRIPHKPQPADMHSKLTAGKQDGNGPAADTSSGHQPGFMYAGVDLASLPKALDWRNASVVSYVKNQGMCGSCWAFATTGAIEGINAIHTHSLLVLSEQELVDCDRDVDMGCSGGMMDNAYQWIIQHKGIHLEQDWPYLAQESAEGCSLQAHRSGQVVTIDGYQSVSVGDEASLLKAVAHQPVAVAVEADSRAFQLYVGGVMSDPGCGSNLNHGVLVVGYGGLEASDLFPAGSDRPTPIPTDAGNGPFWIVKNSWGPAWGADGYIKLQMGFRDNITGMQGLCGITLAASFPVKTSPNPPAPPPAPPPSPKPSPPGPVRCDERFACPESNTCCCLDETATGAACTTWGCCPLEKAICCEDHMHCCPQELPVCDTEGGRCLPPSSRHNGSPKKPSVFSVPWYQNTPALDLQPRTINKPAKRLFPSIKTRTTVQQLPSS